MKIEIHCDDRTGNNNPAMPVVKRFLNYVSFSTSSDENMEGTIPTTERQKDLGRYLRDEFSSLGLSDVIFEENGNGFVYATLPASPGSEDKPVLALLAHMDVSDQAPSEDIHTIITEENGLNYIRTDGRTLLGADDKAGIAEIVTAAEKMLSDSSLVHPEIRIVITTDEETGLGISTIDLSKLNAKWAYTIDGEDLGELSYETWEAKKADITFHGVSAHAGTAYGVMKNPCLMAADFISMLPADKRPETTKDREGFIYVTDISGGAEKAEVSCILREFDALDLEKNVETVMTAAEAVNKKYGEGSCDVNVKDQYPNMKKYIVPDYNELIDNARKAYEECGIEVLEIATRGGTDGSQLSARGVPTPNIGTGGANAHSRSEYITVESLKAVTDFIIALAAKFA